LFRNCLIRQKTGRFLQHLLNWRGMVGLWRGFCYNNSRYDHT
jgi:hypothetical protein